MPDTHTRTQHTPPWRHVGVFVQDANGDVIAMVYSERWSPAGHYYKLTHDECADVARLIAAAPDMLAALVAMVAHTDNLNGATTCNRIGNTCPHITAARAAIAKAHGEE